MKVIVVGSRWWTDPEPVHRALNHLYDLHGHLHVVHAAYRRRGSDEYSGVDRCADDWAIKAIEVGLNVVVERFPARYQLHGAEAEAIRDVAMIEAGVWCDVCQVDGEVLAWPLGTSASTRRCMNLAESNGIRIENYGDRLTRGLRG